MAKKMIAEAKMLRKRKAAEKYSDDENESAEEVTNILQSNLVTIKFSFLDEKEEACI